MNLNPNDRYCPKCGWEGKLEVSDKSTSQVMKDLPTGVTGSPGTIAYQSWCPNCGTKTEPLTIGLKSLPIKHK